jgi:hypothetical protein
MTTQQPKQKTRYQLPIGSFMIAELKLYGSSTGGYHVQDSLIQMLILEIDEAFSVARSWCAHCATSMADSEYPILSSSQHITSRHRPKSGAEYDEHLELYDRLIFPLQSQVALQKPRNPVRSKQIRKTHANSGSIEFVMRFISNQLVCVQAKVGETLG